MFFYMTVSSSKIIIIIKQTNKKQIQIKYIYTEWSRTLDIICQLKKSNSHTVDLILSPVRVFVHSDC